MMRLSELSDFLAAQPVDSTTALQDVWKKVRQEHGEDGALEDDFSIIEFRFT